MSSRTSARFAAAKRQRSSVPLEQQDNPQTHSPPRRRTRSQSVELGSNQSPVSARRGGRSVNQQQSVESDTSNASNASGRAGRRKGITTPALQPELSIVDEDQEEIDIEEDDAEAALGTQHGSESPGGMSQMSGTTAITSHSVAELRDLDTILVEFLPDLLASSYKILDMLAPPGASLDTVKAIMKDLKVLGSRRAKRLKHDEDRFNTDREAYGSDNYIQIPLILRKIFGTTDAASDHSRPDAILHAANLATMVKTLLVTQKQSRTSHRDLGDLHTNFPDAFLLGFDSNEQVGSSNLLAETFSVGLELRTQYTILALLHYKEEPGWNPDEILADYFFEQPDSSTDHFDNLYQDGHVKGILREVSNSDIHVDEIRARVESIREAFRNNPEAVEAGDVVDFEMLDLEFPWDSFIANSVQWARSRFDEVVETIKKQGGIEVIVRSLIETLNSNDSQVELQYVPPPTIMEPRKLLPPADIASGTPGTSFHNKNNVLALEKMKRGIPLKEDLPSEQNQQKPAKVVVSSPGPSGKQAAKSSTAPLGRDNDSSSHNRGDGDELDQHPSSTAQALAAWNARTADKNKENRPVARGGIASSSKPSIMDPQPGETRLEWEEYDSENINTPSKRKRASQDRVEESAESDDAGFQSDHRTHTVNRTRGKSTIRHQSPLPVKQPSKRIRVSHRAVGAAKAERENRERAESVLQRSARRATDDIEDDEDEDANGDGNDRNNQSPPPFTQVSIGAKINTQRAKQAVLQPQKRTPWSTRDSNHLIDLIAEYGCSWSLLQKFARFERGEVGQVALKDRARNIKVAYLMQVYLG